MEQATTSAVLPAFLDVLHSPSPITLPPQTLLGAITHFLSHLEGHSLSRFLRTLVRSPSLWETNLITPRDIRTAVGVSVPSVRARILETNKRAYFGEWRKTLKAREWLQECVDAVRDAGPVPAGIHVQLGFLQGLDDTSLDWGMPRVRLEEDIILGIAGRSDISDGDAMELLCITMIHADVNRLRALDVVQLMSSVETQLCASSSYISPKDHVESSALARAFARSLIVLDSGGPSSKQHARQMMQRFCERMANVGNDLQEDWVSHKDHKDVSGTRWSSHKTALFSFLLPASTMLDILLDIPEEIVPSGSVTFHVQLAAQILVTLSTFVYLTDYSSGGFEHYLRILYGCLDIISERGRMAASERLFRSLQQDRISDAHAAFMLILGDELIHHLGEQSIALLLPVAEKHAHRPQHRPSFEAAHAFFLSLLRSASDTLDTGSPQGEFFDALLPNYLCIIIKQYTTGNITIDQFRESYPLIASCASHRGPPSVSLCLEHLSTLEPSPTTRLLQIRLAPYIPSSDLPQYLDDLSETITSMPAGSEERLELTTEAFKMVTRDLRDDLRVLGVEWWTKRQGSFTGKTNSVGFWKSRL